MPSRPELFGIPVSALSALPACPACYPAYAGILTALGLSGLANARAQAVLTAVLLAAVLGALVYRARSRRGFGPFALGLLGSVIVAVSKFLIVWDPGTYFGVTCLLVASLWNVWPLRIRECAR